MLNPTRGGIAAEHLTYTKVFDEVVDAARALGVVRMSLLFPPPLGSVSARGSTICFFGVNKEWEADYRAFGWSGELRLEDQLLEYGAPLLWRDMEHVLNLDAENRDILARFFHYHPADGISVPLFGPFGSQLLLSFSLDGGVSGIDDPRIEPVVALAVQAQRQLVTLYRSENLPTTPLSPRETAVLRQMASGHSKKEAARALGISLNSIDTYQRRIFSKLDVHDRTEAVVRSLALGLIKL